FENLLPGVVRGIEADGSIAVAVGDTLIRGFAARPAQLGAGAAALVAVRAERLLPESGVPRGDQNVLACRPAKQAYRGKYVDQIATSAVGTVKLRNWDRTQPYDQFEQVTWRAEDCVVLPQ